MTDYDTTGFREAGPHGATAPGGNSVTGQLNSYKFDVIAVTTVNVRAETEEQARAMIDGLNSITTRTTGDDIEAVHGLDVSTRDYDVANVSPRGRGYLVSAESPSGEEISVSEFEEFAEPIMVDDLAGLREELAKADRFLAGDDYADAHEALHDLAETVRGLLAGSSPWLPGKSSLAVSTPDATAAPIRPAITTQRGQGSPASGLTPTDGSEDPRVTAARALVNGPLPRSDRQLPSHVLTSWYHELNRAARGLLEVIDGHPAGTASRVHGPDEPAAPTLETGPDWPLDQIRHLIVQAGTACTHLAAVAPDGPAAARQATEIIGLLTQVRDLAAGRHAHDAAGSSVNPSASPAATLAAAGFPRPPLSADPGADSASARKPDTSHPRQQQVPPGTQGRHQ